MASKAASKNKGKKPLETTLGKAPAPSKKEIDLSQLRTPIETTVANLQHLFSLLDKATEEVQTYVKYECDILYECRTCRSIFRSLANFILHKRKYCRARFNPLEHENCHSHCQNFGNLEPHLLVEISNDKEKNISEPVDEDVKQKRISSVINKLVEKQKINILAAATKNEDLSVKSDTSKEKSLSGDDYDKEILLEEMKTSSAAVFQNVFQELKKDAEKSEFMKSQVMEIHGILDSNEAVLGPDGKVKSLQMEHKNEIPDYNKNNHLICSDCDLRFSSKKTFTYHVKYKHNDTRLVYICPECKEMFANTWCVYRHLYKVHRKTTAQIRKMRDHVHSNLVRKDQQPMKKRTRAESKDGNATKEKNNEDQWLDNIEEDTDLQMCGGCGKRFERKAALHSHSATCVKRIAVCNTIKELNSKKKEHEEKEQKTKKHEKATTPEATGASKRKPHILRTYKQRNNKNDPGSKSADDLAEVKITSIMQAETKAICSQDEVEAERRLSEIRSSLDEIPLDGAPNSVFIKVDFSKDKASETPTFKNEVDLCDDAYSSEAENLKCADKKRVEIVEHLEEVDCDIEERDQKSEEAKDSLVCAQVVLGINSKKSSENIVFSLNCENYNENNYDYTEESKVPSSIINKSTAKDSIEVIDITNTDSSEDSASSTISDVTSKIKSGSSTPSDEMSNGKDAEDAFLGFVNGPRGTEDELGQTFGNVPTNINDTDEASSSNHCIKRKRSTSEDSEATNLNKISRFVSETSDTGNDGDETLITKASSYMDKTSLLCIPCQETFNSLPQLLWHMSTHFSWFKFQCSKCNFMSFNKYECESHARIEHKIKNCSLQSTVLPIPNWKAVLLSHDFILNKNQEYPYCLEFNETCDETESEKNLDGEDDSDVLDNFNLVSPLNETSPSEEPIPNSSQQFKGIDLLNTSETFKLELPQEIYSSGFDLQGQSDSETPRYRVEGDPVCEDSISEMDDFDFVIPEKLPNGVAKDNDGSSDSNDAETHSDPLQINISVPHEVNVRPIRNRQRSVRTLQTDFIYDLNKVLCFNKNNASGSTKQSKDSGKPRVIRVYSKKKNCMDSSDS